MESTKVRKKPTYCVQFNGLLTTEDFKPTFPSALAYEPEADDVFIATYPKCGTTWMQCILNLLKNKGEPLVKGQNINAFIPHLEEVGREGVEKLARPRIIKTHLPFDMVPKSSTAKYIYIARNPKDCCVSFYHHTKGFPKYYRFEDGTFNDYFELFLDGKVDFGDYFDHLLSWFKHRNDPNVLFLLYEDMKMDTIGCIKRIGEFLGDIFLRSTEDDAILEKVLENSKFGVMKSSLWMWSSERQKQFEPFIRKGEVGDWRSYFSEDQSKRLGKKFKTKLLGSGAEHLWDQYDC